MISQSAKLRAEIASRVCAVTAVAIGATGLIGWIFDVPALQRIHPELVTMKANTAIAIILAGISLWLLQEETVAGMKRWLAQGCAASVALIGLLTLGEILFGWDPGIDQLLFQESQAAAGQSFPGRMGIMSALVFSSLGVALLILDIRIAGRYRAGLLSIGALIAATVVFLIYFYDIVVPVSAAKYLTVALHTVVAFWALSAGILLARPRRGAMATLTGSTTGGVVARRMLPAAFFLPILLGWVVRMLTRDLGAVGPGLDLAIFVVISILLFCALVVGTVRAIDRQEALADTARLALNRSEADLRDFVENATVGLHWVGPDGTILWANQTELDTLGYARTEYVGQPIAKFHADPAAINDILARLTAGEAVRDYSAQLRRKDGAIRDVVISSNALFEAGRLVHTRCFTRDITEQRLAEAAKARLAAIVEGSNDAIIGKTLEGMIDTWNSGAEKIFGYSASEAIGQPVLMLIPPERRGEEHEILARIGRGESVKPFEAVRLRKDGSHIHVSVSISPVKDASGKVVAAAKVARDITERKQMEDDLRESHQFTRRVLDNVLAFAGVLTVDGTLIQANRAPLEAAGISFSEVLGKKFWDCTWWSYSPEVQARLRAACESAAAGEVVRYDVPVRMAGETMLWIDFQLAPLRDNDGRITHLIPSGADITERRRGEESLRQNAELFVRLVDQTPTGMCVVDADFRLQQVNALAAPVFAKIDPLIGRDLTEINEVLWGPEVAAEVARIFRHTLDTGERYVSPSFTHERQDIGGEQTYEWQIQRVTPADGRYGVACYFEDVTERKRAERAIHESEMRLRLATEATAAGIWEWNLLTNAVRWDARMFRLYGIAPTADGFVRYSDWSVAVLPEDLAENERILQNTIRCGGQSRREFRIRRRADGEVRVIEAVETVRTNENGEAEWRVGTNVDATERKADQDSIRRTAAVIARASRAKDDFLAALSHELRTPLTPVLLTAAALRDDDRLPADVREQLGMMERNIALEARLIDDLLDLTTIERGKLQLRLQPSDAHSLIGLAIEIVRDSARAKDLVIVRDFNAAHSTLRVDPARFQQVVWNLLRNAVKFTPTGGTITVTTRDEVSPAGIPWLRFEVADSGIGIEPGNLEGIFKPFEQGAHTGSHRFGGLGLGLAIARAVVELHGGNISAHSDGPNRGATFVVKMAGATEVRSGVAAGDPPLRADASPGPALPGPTAATGLPLRLLLVEDHESTLKTLALLLRRDGHHVVTAVDLASARAAAAAGQFDLVVSDLGLPDGSGIELMEHLRAIHGLRGIALSGYGMEEDVARSREAGFVTHLVKPVAIADLRRALAAFAAAAAAT